MHGIYISDDTAIDYLAVTRLYGDGEVSPDFVSSLQNGVGANETYFYLADVPDRIAGFRDGTPILVDRPGVPEALIEIAPSPVEIKLPGETPGLEWAGGPAGIVFIDDGRGNYLQRFVIDNLHTDSNRVRLKLTNKSRNWSGSFDAERGVSGDFYGWDETDAYLTLSLRFDNAAGIGTYALAVDTGGDPYHTAPVPSRRFIVHDFYEHRRHRYVEPAEAPDGSRTSFTFDASRMGLLDPHLPLKASPGSVDVLLNTAVPYRGEDFSEKADGSGVDFVDAPEEGDRIRFHITRRNSGHETHAVLNGIEIVPVDVEGRIRFPRITAPEVPQP